MSTENENVDPNVVIDVNTLSTDALQEQLRAVKGVGPMISNAIVAEREQNGPFQDWDEVQERLAKSKAGAGRYKRGLTSLRKAPRPFFFSPAGKKDKPVAAPKEESDGDRLNVKKEVGAHSVRRSIDFNDDEEVKPEPAAAAADVEKKPKVEPKVESNETAASDLSTLIDDLDNLAVDKDSQKPEPATAAADGEKKPKVEPKVESNETAASDLSTLIDDLDNLAVDKDSQGQSMFETLKQLDSDFCALSDGEPVVHKSDYFDERTGEWDVEGMRSDIAITRSDIELYQNMTAEQIDEFKNKVTDDTDE